MIIVGERNLTEVRSFPCVLDIAQKNWTVASENWLVIFREAMSANCKFCYQIFIEAYLIRGVRH